MAWKQKRLMQLFQNYRHQIHSPLKWSLTCMTLCSWLRHVSNSIVNHKPDRVPSHGWRSHFGFSQKQKLQLGLVRLLCHHIYLVWIPYLSSGVMCVFIHSESPSGRCKEGSLQNNNCPDYFFKWGTRNFGTICNISSGLKWNCYLAPLSFLFVLSVQ